MQQDQVIKSLSKQFKDITVARKWLFHDNDAHLSGQYIANHTIAHFFTIAPKNIVL